MSRIIIAVISLFIMSPGIAADNEGQYLYRVTTVRAAPATLPDLLDGLHEVRQSSYYEDTGQPAPLVMRHSQGDQWDLLFITPMGSWTEYYNPAAVEQRANASLDITKKLHALTRLLAFSEDHFAFGPSFELVHNAYTDNAFFHIEMFAAAPGKTAELVEQRRMENNYLKTVGLTENMIFYRAAGSNVDAFTIGFHDSLQAFAEPSTATPEEKDAAAKAAGFDALSDISFYLRTLISAHHDTLAVKVD